jgi:hypothetical protein
MLDETPGRCWCLRPRTRRPRRAAFRSSGGPIRPPRATREFCSSTAWRAKPPLPLVAVAVPQTPGEAAGSLLRVGSEIGHRIRQATPVRLDAVAPSPSQRTCSSVSETALCNSLHAKRQATSAVLDRSLDMSHRPRSVRRGEWAARSGPHPPQPAFLADSRAGRARCRAGGKTR